MKKLKLTELAENQIANKQLMQIKGGYDPSLNNCNCQWPKFITRRIGKR